MKRTFPINLKHHPRGALLAEAVVASVILGVAISLLVPALTAIGRQRQAMRFDALAMIELNNMADVIRTTTTPVTELNVSRWFSERYSDARLTAELVPPESDVSKGAVEAVRLSIGRSAVESMPEQKVSIVVWRLKGAPAP